MANSVTLKLDGFDNINELLQQFPMLVIAAGGPTDRAVKRAAEVVVNRAKQLAPDSSKTGSRSKQSKKSKAIWDGKLNRLIRIKSIRYDGGNSSWAVVGPKSREGNMSHFQQEKPRRLVLWGKTTRIQPYRIARNWMTQAFDETKPEQLSAMEQSLKKDIDAIARSM